MKKILLLIFLLAIPLSAQSSDFDERVEKGIREIYNIKFQEAEATFRSIMTDYPNHPAGRFLLAMIDWWNILLDTDVETYDELFFQKLEDVIYQCDQILENEPENIDALFFKGGAIGFRGRLRSLRESWLKAADDGREALPIVEYASKLDPDNIDVQLGFGIYNYYADVIPDEYPIIKPLMIFFPSGNREEGIAQLKNVAFNGKYAKYEARYFLMTLYSRYEKNTILTEDYARLLSDDFPDNPVFQRWRGRNAVRRGEMNLADSIFKVILHNADLNMTGYNIPKYLREATYYVGYNYKINFKLDSAKTYLERCIDISKKIDEDEESGFQINAIVYLAQTLEAQQNIDEAIKLYERLLEMPEYGGSHEIAEGSLKRLKKM